MNAGISAIGFEAGGAIFARRGMTTIASQTLIIDNTASVEGQTMVVEPAASGGRWSELAAR